MLAFFFPFTSCTIILDVNPELIFFEGKRFSLSNTQMFAILEGVDASSKTSFLTNLFKVDDKIECGFSATIGRMGSTVLNFVKNGRRDFATVMRNVNLAVIKWSWTCSLRFLKDWLVGILIFGFAKMQLTQLTIWGQIYSAFPATGTSSNQHVLQKVQWPHITPC